MRQSILPRLQALLCVVGLSLIGYVSSAYLGSAWTRSALNRQLDSSRQAVVAADEEIRAAAEAERAVGERYKAGVATTTDVLDAQVARLQAELDRTRAIANVRLAEARLERALGR